MLLRASCLALLLHMHACCCKLPLCDAGRCSASCFTLYTRCRSTFVWLPLDIVESKHHNCSCRQPQYLVFAIIHWGMGSAWTCLTILKTDWIRLHCNPSVLVHQVGCVKRIRQLTSFVADTPPHQMFSNMICNLQSSQFCQSFPLCQSRSNAVLQHSCPGL